MNFNECLNLEIKKCLTLLNDAESIKLIDSNGKLIITKENKMYYVINNEEGKEIRKYIQKKDKKFSKDLATKSYVKKVRKIWERKIKVLKDFKKNYDVFEVEKFYNSLPENRRELLDSVKLSYQQCVKEWKNAPYIGLNLYDESKKYVTKNGEHVRSKSEKIIVDILHDYGNAYKYECPVHLKNGIYYPDFTILCPYTLKEIYWEHNGLMDNPQYCNNAIKKIKEYENNGIFRGENLIVTFESSDSVLDIEWVDKLIRKYILSPSV